MCVCVRACVRARARASVLSLSPSHSLSLRHVRARACPGECHLPRVERAGGEEEGDTGPNPGSIVLIAALLDEQISQVHPRAPEQPRAITQHRRVTCGHRQGRQSPCYRSIFRSALFGGGAPWKEEGGGEQGWREGAGGIGVGGRGGRVAHCG